tara:strand:- start:1359 stop:1691 length:333 start_codon:yes stop_codon:yes gene_type:complete
MFENRRWLVIPTTLTSSIDFNQVLESSADTLRLSIDGNETFVKYEINEVTASYEEYYQDAEDPDTWFTSSIEAGVYGRPSIYDSQYTEYNHTKILNLLTGSNWTTTGSLG